MLSKFGCECTLSKSDLKCYIRHPLKKGIDFWPVFEQETLRRFFRLKVVIRRLKSGPINFSI